MKTQLNIALEGTHDREVMGGFTVTGESLQALFLGG